MSVINRYLFLWTQIAWIRFLRNGNLPMNFFKEKPFLFMFKVCFSRLSLMLLFLINSGHQNHAIFCHVKKFLISFGRCLAIPHCHHLLISDLNEYIVFIDKCAILKCTWRGHSTLLVTLQTRSHGAKLRKNEGLN